MEEKPNQPRPRPRSPEERIEDSSEDHGSKGPGSLPPPPPPPPRSLANVSPETRNASTPDLQIFGGELWECISKASSKSQGWMKSTKRMAVDGGTLFQVSTEHREVDHRMVVVNGEHRTQHDLGEVIACAEALAFVPYPRDAFDEPVEPPQASGPLLDTDGRVIDGHPHVFLTEYHLTAKAAAEQMMVGRLMAGPEITAISWREAASLAALLRMPGQEDPMRVIGRLVTAT